MKPLICLIANKFSALNRLLIIIKSKKIPFIQFLTVFHSNFHFIDDWSLQKKWIRLIR